MNLKLTQLEAFVWVADLGSFRKAAERLNTTQPNISARISSLEATLDAKLLERDAGSVRLTAKGGDLLQHARTVLKSAEQFVEASGQASLYDGVLKLGVTELVVHTWLREFLRVFKEQFPNVLVELTVDFSATLRDALFERSIDLAFQNGPFQRQTSGHVDLGRYPLVWVASVDLDVSSRRKLDAADLVRHPILTHARDTQPFEQVEAHFSELGQTGVRLVPSSSLAPCIHMTLEGMGIAVILEALVKKEIKERRLRRIKYDWVPDDLHFFARYEAERAPHHVAMAAELAGATAAAHAKKR